MAPIPPRRNPYFKTFLTLAPTHTLNRLEYACLSEFLNVDTSISLIVSMNEQDFGVISFKLSNEKGQVGLPVGFTRAESLGRYEPGMMNTRSCCEDHRQWSGHIGHEKRRDWHTIDSEDKYWIVMYGWIQNPVLRQNFRRKTPVIARKDPIRISRHLSMGCNRVGDGTWWTGGRVWIKNVGSLNDGSETYGRESARYIQKGMNAPS